MTELTQKGIYNRFPWAKPVNLEFSDFEKEFFYDITPWSFNQTQLKLIYTMLEEVENWFILKQHKHIEVIIMEYKEVQGHIFVEKICRFPEVDNIFVKYRAIYAGEE